MVKPVGQSGALVGIPVHQAKLVLTTGASVPMDIAVKIQEPILLPVISATKNVLVVHVLRLVAQVQTPARLIVIVNVVIRMEETRFG